MEQEVHAPVVTVLDLGLSNSVSLRKSIQQCGYPTETISGGDISGAQILCLPGFGSLAHIIELLQERGWYDALCLHVEAGKPYLGIGAGMHLLFDGTTDGECPGWAILPCNVEKLEAWDCSVPHIGYGKISLFPGRISLAGFNWQVYFAHTHAVTLLDEDAAWVVGTKAFGEQTVVTMVNTGKAFGTQFCPTRSGATGLQLLRSILNELSGVTFVNGDGAADAVGCSASDVDRRLVAHVTVPAAYAGSEDHLLQYTRQWNNEVLLRGSLDDLLSLLIATEGNITVPITACSSVQDHSSPSGRTNGVTAEDTVSAAEKLFRAGADRVVLGEEAVRAAAAFLTTGVMTGDSVIEQLSRKFGAHAVAVSIDAVREPVDNPLNPFDLTGSDADSAACPFPALGSTPAVVHDHDENTLSHGPALTESAAAADPSVLQIVAETEDEHPELGMLRGMGSTLVHLQSGDHCCWKVRIPSSVHDAAPVYVDAVVLAKACEIMGAGEVYLNIHNAGHLDTPLVNAVQNALRIHVVACGGATEIAANVEELTRLGSSAIAVQGSIEDVAALCALLSVACSE